MNTVLGNSSGSCRINGDDRVKQSILVAQADISLQEIMVLNSLGDWWISFIWDAIYRDIIHNCLKSQQTTLLVIVIVVPWEAQLYNAWFKKLSHLHSVTDMFISRNQKSGVKMHS